MVPGTIWNVQHVNEAWGAAFWSQEVRSFDEIDVPRHMGNDAMANPSKQLDFTGSVLTRSERSTWPSVM